MTVADPPTRTSEAHAEYAPQSHSASRGFLERILAALRRVEQPAPAALWTTSLVQRSPWTDVGASVDHTMATFVEVAAAEPDVIRIDARASGPRVDFIVTVDGPWDEAIDRIEPRLRELRLDPTSSFDYSVVSSARKEPRPPGFGMLFSR